MLRLANHCKKPLSNKSILLVHPLGNFECVVPYIYINTYKIIQYKLTLGVGDTSKSIWYDYKYFQPGIETLSIQFWVLKLNDDVISLCVCFSHWYNI